MILEIALCQCAFFIFFLSYELHGKSVMVSWFVDLMEFIQLKCRMKELFKHDYCYFIIKDNVRNINFFCCRVIFLMFDKKTVAINGFLAEYRYLFEGVFAFILISS